MADVCGFFREMAQQKKDSTGSPYLGDEEIYDCLMTYGLVRGSEKSLERTSETMTLKEATTITRLQV